MNHDLPQISNCSNTSNAYVMTTTGDLGVYGSALAGSWDNRICDPYAGNQFSYTDVSGSKHAEKLREMVKETIKEKPMSNGRVVQVFIVDPDKNLPVDKRLIYMGDQLFTDMTDQDLFFDIDIKKILATHNDLRALTIDKKRSSATEKVFLEPVRVSDLKMVVSVIANF